MEEKTEKKKKKSLLKNPWVWVIAVTGFATGCYFGSRKKETVDRAINSVEQAGKSAYNWGKSKVMPKPQPAIETTDVEVPPVQVVKQPNYANNGGNMGGGFNRPIKGFNKL